MAGRRRAADDPGGRSVTELERFFDAVFGQVGGVVELRPLPERDGVDFQAAQRARRWLPVAEAARVAPVMAEWCPAQGLGCFFGVLPRMEPGKGTKANVGPGRVLWADLDFKDYEDGEEEARERLTLLRAPPSVLVSSGNGLHAYWLLTEPAEPEAIEAANTAIIEATGADAACKDSARVLRLPGSVNIKDPDDPRRVVFEYLDEGLAYDLDQIVKAADARRPQTPEGLEPREADHSRYVTATLEGVLGDIAAAGKGTRNRTLNQGAYALGRLVGAGVFTRDQARQELTAAGLAIGLGGQEISRTIESGISAGEAKPWMPDPSYKAGASKAPGNRKPGRPPKPPPGGCELEVWHSLRLKERPREPYQTIGNVSSVLDRDSRWGGRIWLDEMADQVFIDGKPLSDDIEREAAVWLEDHYSLAASTALVHEALCMVAARHKRHPLREKLDSLAEAWDGEPRADEWLSKYVGAPDDELHAAIGRAWLVSAVARVYEPGAKVDTMPILVGPQGARKSTALRLLAMEDQWFSDSHLDFNYGIKDAYLSLSGVWIYEVAELDGITRAKEMSTVKAFISSSEDRFRPSYGRNMISRPRQTILCGSTNESGFLRDATGSRRFWPIKVGKIDADGLKAAVPFLWGEAVHWYRGGEAWHLSPEIEAQRVTMAENYQSRDPWADAILKWTKTQIAPFTVSEVIDRALGMDLERADSRTHRRVVVVLTADGFERVRLRRDGVKVRAWQRPKVIELPSQVELST